MNICKRMVYLNIDYHALINPPDSRSRDKADILMLMYEFEARCKLQDPTVEEVIEVLLKIPNPDPKPFETIAGKYDTKSIPCSVM